VLINCAGVANAVKTVGRDRETGAIKPYPLHQFELAIQINLIGTFRCIAKSAAGMLTLEPGEDGERGAIVNTAAWPRRTVRSARRPIRRPRAACSP
jgi:NAD(P)-dependent dehydrogenase (short-subunit alcohol dehydrogenase family)